MQGENVQTPLGVVACRILYRDGLCDEDDGQNEVLTLRRGSEMKCGQKSDLFFYLVTSVYKKVKYLKINMKYRELCKFETFRKKLVEMQKESRICVLACEMGIGRSKDWFDIMKLRLSHAKLIVSIAHTDSYCTRL
jgi:hypothetical protein